MLKEGHGGHFAGHFGVFKTWKGLTRVFWWPGMLKDVKAHVDSCASCQMNKSSNKKPGGALQPLPLPNAQWETVTMDLITELPGSDRGHDAILVMVDKLSKMVHCAPTCKTVDAVGVAHLFLRWVLTLHGVPNLVITDRDPRFGAAFLQEVEQYMGTEHRFSTAYHPQTDGQTERTNRVVEEVLRVLVSPSQDDWDLWLPIVEFAINNSYNETTGNTPFFLNYGRHPQTPQSRLTQLYDQRQPEYKEAYHKIASEVPGFKNPAAVRFSQQMDAILHKAKNCLQAAQQRQKAQANKKRSDISFNVGEQVLLSTKNIDLFGVKKLLPKYIGPFKVLKKVGTVAYRINLPEHFRIHDVFHVSLLKPYRADGAYQPPPIPKIIDGEFEYEVERIVAHRDEKAKGRHKGIIQEYLIHWKGYSKAYDTWEPLEMLTHCQKILDEYHRANDLPMIKRKGAQKAKVARQLGAKPARKAKPKSKPKPRQLRRNPKLKRLDCHLLNAMRLSLYPMPNE